MSTYTVSTTVPTKATVRKSTRRTSPALAARIEQLETRLRKYAARNSNAMTTADDLYQIAVEEILTNCSPEDNDTYILRLADWRMKNATKKELTYSIRISEVEVEPEDDEIASIVVDTSTPEGIAEANEIRAAILRITSGMSEQYQQILAMLADGMSHREIARQLGTSQPLVSYHIKKIRTAFETAGLSPAFAMA